MAQITYHSEILRRLGAMCILLLLSVVSTNVSEVMLLQSVV